jgi:hypothetical protein
MFSGMNPGSMRFFAAVAQVNQKKMKEKTKKQVIETQSVTSEDSANT